VQYAENPAEEISRYLSIDFETANYAELAEELKSLISFWISQGIKIFRVDNPHTKPLRFGSGSFARRSGNIPTQFSCGSIHAAPK